MIQNIIWDFDGVILDSVPIKSEAFVYIFRNFPKEQVEELLKYHLINGGLSRFDKISYFFQTIRQDKISQEELDHYALEFSNFSLRELYNPRYLIPQTIQFIKSYHNRYNMHIASGAWEKDLLDLCQYHHLDRYFLSIHGSPPHKNILVERILQNNPSYQRENTCIIGDSLNDYDAAKHNGISYYGFNNEKMRTLAEVYLEDYHILEK